MTHTGSKSKKSIKLSDSEKAIIKGAKLFGDKSITKSSIGLKVLNTVLKERNPEYENGKFFFTFKKGKVIARLFLDKKTRYFKIDDVKGGTFSTLYGYINPQEVNAYRNNPPFCFGHGDKPGYFKYELNKAKTTNDFVSYMMFLDKYFRLPAKN